MSVPGEMPWAKVVERGHQLRVPLSSRSHHQDSTVKYVPEIIFQTLDFETELLNRRAASIAHQTLTTGSVIFKFPPGTFANHLEVYEAIDTELGPMEGFQHLSGFTPNPSKGDMLIEARFESTESRDRAIQTGLVVGDVTFRGTASSSGTSSNSFVHVALSVINIPTKAELLLGLSESLAHYGTVHQIKKHAPASFKGAAPVCFYCRQAGHFRRDCPKLKDQVCFGCGVKDHTRRFCSRQKEKRVESVTEADMLDEYIQLRNQAKETVRARRQRASDEPQQPTIHSSIPVALEAIIKLKDYTLILSILLNQTLLTRATTVLRPPATMDVDSSEDDSDQLPPVPDTGLRPL
ncbi:hypothetical protein A0J61_10323 [Choanephora cucurbitarum]|uniref:CCHC-type domain-containing protein n=1 Tax=Choanephora cucurbitarum TaxID=101091 RepID=A0A1C7MXV1_9FUNG|nr:hypothetical protein A0J61_10323 [Choanephora cucurbitarum]